MAGLDGKITIERELSPCIVHISQEISQPVDMVKDYVRYGAFGLKREEQFKKGLFHMWSPVTGKAIVECEDGTMREVNSKQIRFVDNPMCEYAFPEMEETQ